MHLKTLKIPGLPCKCWPPLSESRLLRDKTGSCRVSSSASPDCLSKFPTTAYPEVSVSAPSSMSFTSLSPCSTSKYDCPCTVYLFTVIHLSSLFTNACVHRSLALSYYPIEYIVSNKQHRGHRRRLCRRSRCRMLGSSGHLLHPTRSVQEVSSRSIHSDSGFAGARRNARAHVLSGSTVAMAAYTGQKPGSTTSELASERTCADGCSVR